MKQYEFLAYDKEKDRLCNVFVLDYFTNSGVTNNRPSHIFVEYYDSLGNCHRYDNIGDKFELLEYTGFKDSFGKKIYDGFVVEIGHLGKCVVEWCFADGCWVFVRKNNDGAEESYSWSDIIDFSKNVVGVKFSDKIIL